MAAPSEKLDLGAVLSEWPLIQGGARANVPLELKTARHQELVYQVRHGGPFDVAFIGDSIVQTLCDFGDKYAGHQKTWDRHLLPRRAINLGHDGFRIEHLLWNLNDGELDFPVSPKVFVLQVGTNNCDDRNFTPVHTAREIYGGTRAIVRAIRRRHPTSRILVLRMFPRGGDNDVAVSLPAFHSSQPCITTCRVAGELTRRLADNRHVYWLDVNQIFLRPDGSVDSSMLWDLLHPSPAGAEAWVRHILPTVDRLLEEAAAECDVVRLFPWLDDLVRSFCEWGHCMLCSKHRQRL